MTGRLVAMEGLSGTGKTHLVRQAVQRLGDRAPIVLEGFSERIGRPDLGSRIITELAHDSSGDRFLRAGHPLSETLLLLAVQMHKYETALPYVREGRDVLEGRGVHAVAVYQAVLRHPDDGTQALGHAQVILETATAWRPLPDMVILVTDDVSRALARAEARDGAPFTSEERGLHRQADRLFAQLAAADPARFHVLDRRATDPRRAVDRLCDWLGAARSPRSAAS
jgi:dTMP kinase